MRAPHSEAASMEDGVVSPPCHPLCDRICCLTFWTCSIWSFGTNRKRLGLMEWNRSAGLMGIPVFMSFALFGSGLLLASELRACALNQQTCTSTSPSLASYTLGPSGRIESISTCDSRLIQPHLPVESQATTTTPHYGDVCNGCQDAATHEYVMLGATYTALNTSLPECDSKRIRLSRFITVCVGAQPLLHLHCRE
jgi:hypothetical protein